MHGEQCGAESVFDVEVPSSEDDFHVDAIRYESAAAGQRTTVEIDGRFGEQVGVLINGTPLQKVASVGLPTLVSVIYNPPANSGDPSVQGVFELVHGTQIIASFVMPATFAQTPKITLVTAGRAALLNNFHAWPGANGEQALTGSVAKPMFTQIPSISRVDRSLVRTDKSLAHLTIVGRGFSNNVQDALLLGGTALSKQAGEPQKANEYHVENNGLINALIDRESAFPHWSLDYMSFDGQQAMDTNLVIDDDLPPVVATCMYTTKSVEGKATASFTIKGKFLTQTYVPSTSNKEITLANAALTGDTLWTFDAAAKDGIAFSPVLLKGPKPSDNLTLSCNVEGKEKISARAKKSPASTKTHK